MKSKQALHFVPNHFITTCIGENVTSGTLQMEAQANATCPLQKGDQKIKFTGFIPTVIPSVIINCMQRLERVYESIGCTECKALLG